MQALAAIVLLVVFGGICWSLLRPRAAFIIRLSGGAVKFTGAFPRSRYPEVEEFLRREFAGRSPITISGVRTPDRGLRIIVRGSISEGDRQRVRNFFQLAR